jgi:hypothetical protein
VASNRDFVRMRGLGHIGIAPVGVRCGRPLVTRPGLTLCCGSARRPRIAFMQISKLNEAHTEHWPRYPRTKAKPVFVVENFDTDADDLFRSVSIALYPGIAEADLPVHPSAKT